MISISFALSLGSASGQAGQILIWSSLTLLYCLLLGSLTSPILSVSPVACPFPLELRCGADVKRRPGLSCRHLTPDLNGNVLSGRTVRISCFPREWEILFSELGEASILIILQSITQNTRPLPSRVTVT